MNRESFGSRLGFILVSAGCAIGLGNVWKFPYICGQYGGAAFILVYLLFLGILGIPVLICEFSIGRASRKSVAKSFEELAPAGTKWHHLKYIGIAGCYLLMMFYTMVGGWLLFYCFKSLRGDFHNISPDEITANFSTMLSSPKTMIFWSILVVILGFSVVYLGLKNGVEKITKIMMLALLFIMVVLAINSVLMPGASEGIKFYLIPDLNKMVENGIGNVVFAALSQAFFTLSLGVGAMLIFGSYLDRSRSLTGEAISITLLDTSVALVAGFIVIPACFAYGIEPNAGPSLIFITLPNIFSQMKGGIIFSFLFFLFLSFAALSTIIAVFENIISFHIDLYGWSRKKSVFVGILTISILSMPCVLGFNVLSHISLLGPGTNIMDFEDFLVSNNLIPLGSLSYVLFCTHNNGWGFSNFLQETNAGKGMIFPGFLKPYLKWVVPAIIIVIYLKGYYDMFKPQGLGILIRWMILAFLFLFFIIACATKKNFKKN